MTLTLFVVLKLEKITTKTNKQTNKQCQQNQERYSIVQLVLKLSKNYGNISPILAILKYECEHIKRSSKTSVKKPNKQNVHAAG